MHMVAAQNRVPSTLYMDKGRWGYAWAFQDWWTGCTATASLSPLRSVMGETDEALVDQYKISRMNRTFALRSQQCGRKPIKTGRFNDENPPVTLDETKKGTDG